jgi:chromate reductase
MAIRVGLIVGSLRKGAYTRMLGNAVKELKPGSWTVTDLAIGDLPLYNQDLETETPPPAWTAFRSQASACDGILIITPEYNRGMPGALKNAIDVGTRPWGKSFWKDRPTAAMSLTPGPLGAMAAHQNLRHTMSVIASPMMPGPEIYMPNAASLFDEGGTLKNEDTKKIITGFLADFEKWIARFR